MTPRILNCTYEQYLKDDIGADTPTLNASVAKVFVKQSPAHALLCHPKLTPQKERSSNIALDKGSVIHSLLLGVGKKTHIMQSVYGPKSKRAGQTVTDYTTDAAQTERDDAYARGEIPLFASQADEIQQAAISISRNLTEAGIDLEAGQSEFMIHWKSDEGVQCRRSLDNWTESKRQIIELKSIFNAHPEVCANQAMRLGYDIECAASLDAIYALYPELAGRVDFIFVFFELEPPYAVTPLRPDGSFITPGISKWGRAKEMWQEGVNSNYWPTYISGIGQLSAPMWAIRAEMEHELS